MSERAEDTTGDGEGTPGKGPPLAPYSRKTLTATFQDLRYRHERDRGQD